MAHKDLQPIVFVHGLAGWGGDAILNRVAPYWGGLEGSIPKYLGEQGYECYTASVGPFSSAWDRVCDLYAQLSGTRTDYGVAHSAARGHARYGKTYDRPLVPGWSEGRRIHLVGHSFGGTTIRLFAQLAEQGCAEERGTTPEEELSPLFSGALGGRVLSITTFATPHNGSTLLEPEVNGGEDAQALMVRMAQAAVIAPIGEKLYPIHMEQFGVSFSDFLQAPKKITGAVLSLKEIEDSAKTDLTVDGAAALNETIRCQPGIYYFSYAALCTQLDLDSSQVPRKDMIFLLRGNAADMGRKREPFRTAGGILIDDAWLPNDGQVNLISALYPFNEPHQGYDPENLRPGVWQTMPVIEGRDHITCVGRVSVGGGGYLKKLYASAVNILETIPRTGSALG